MCVAQNSVALMPSHTGLRLPLGVHVVTFESHTEPTQWKIQESFSIERKHFPETLIQRLLQSRTGRLFRTSFSEGARQNLELLYLYPHCGFEL